MNTLKSHNMSAAAVCRENGWGVGTRLVGDEGYGPTVIEITALGESTMLAKQISHDGDTRKAYRENNWALWCRDWKEVKP